MNPIRSVILLAFLFVSSSTAEVRLAPFPVRVVERLALTDEKVPAKVLAGSNREARAEDGATWRAVEKGLVRERRNHRDPLERLQYFQGPRYLYDDAVEHIEPLAGNPGVMVRTRTGVARIELRPMRLAEKAAEFEKRVTARHDRLGMVAPSILDRPGDLNSNRLHPDDNDGLWTAMYGAAECFRYGVTRSPDALARARRATGAVLKLEEVTGRPGYPARSYIRKGDWRSQGGVWHWSADGAVEWKSDTSSDEIVGHFYLFALAHDLLPSDAALRKRIRETAVRIMDHILRFDLNLTDIHGQPTYWGRWSQDYFATPRGKGDGPLNALELLSFLLVTHHLTGEAKYKAEYDRLIDRDGYLTMASRLDELREEINYSDEELAMLPFYLIFRYEKNAARLAVYRQAMEAWWRNIQRERNPLWMFIYQTGHPERRIDMTPAAYTLYRIPMDLINWAVDNSWRKDIEWSDKKDRFGRREALTWLPPDERPMMKWNNNPFVVTGGGAGTSEDDGAFYLLPYWMGRYYKYLVGE